MAIGEIAELPVQRNQLERLAGEDRTTQVAFGTEAGLFKQQRLPPPRTRIQHIEFLGYLSLILIIGGINFYLERQVAPIPCMSAPIFNVMAGKLNKSIT